MSKFPKRVLLPKFISYIFITERKVKLPLYTPWRYPERVNFDARWRWVSRFTPQPLHPHKSLRYPSNRRLSGPPPPSRPVRSSQGGKTSSLLALGRRLHHPTRRTVATLTPPRHIVNEFNPALVLVEPQISCPIIFRCPETWEWQGDRASHVFRTDFTCCC